MNKQTLIRLLEECVQENPGNSFEKADYESGLHDAYVVALEYAKQLEEPKQIYLSHVIGSEQWRYKPRSEWSFEDECHYAAEYGW